MTPSSALPSSTGIPRTFVPEYLCALEGIEYYVPLCHEGGQKLFRADGTPFTLFCDRIELEDGTKFVFPANPGLDPICQVFPALSGNLCCRRRFEKEKSELQAFCLPGALISQRQLPNVNKTKEALDKVADALAALGGSAGGSAASGLATLSCTAAEEFHQIGLHFLDLAFKPLVSNAAELILQWGQAVVSGFFESIGKGAGNLQVQMDEWLDTTDEAIMAVACIFDENGVHYGAVYRAVTQHSHLHQSMNILLSLKAVGNRNLVQKLFDLLGNVILGVRKAQLEYIGRSGSAILGWAQTQRLCYTRWDRTSLQNNDQPPDDDDEDDWSPRYWIRTRAGTDTATLKSIAAVTDGGAGRELATKQWDADIPPSYVTDIHPLQAILARACPGVVVVDKQNDHDAVVQSLNSPYWNSASFGEVFDDEPEPVPTQARQDDTDLGPRQLPTTGSISSPTSTNTAAGFIPSSNEQQKDAQHLALLSAEKGQDPADDSYYYHMSAGKGSWIFLVDTGFNIDWLQQPVSGPNFVLCQPEDPC